jgi:hypothetical protein
MLDPTTFPPTVARLIDLRYATPLGPGTPVDAGGLLEAIDDNAFGRVVDRDMAAACRAGLWLRFSHLDESHRISQELHTREGGYWHALMHRREPDHANAAYWFRRVGTHPVFDPLRESAADIAAESGGRAGDRAAFLTRQTRWDPFAFNDLCEASAETTAPAHDLCRRVQQAEWELLFTWCFDRATGRSDDRRAAQTS